MPEAQLKQICRYLFVLADQDKDGFLCVSEWYKLMPLIETFKKSSQTLANFEMQEKRRNLIFTMLEESENTRAEYDFVARGNPHGVEWDYFWIYMQSNFP